MSLKTQEKEDAENMFFSIVSADNPIVFFKNLAASRHSNVIQKNKYIRVRYENGKNTILYPFISLNPLNIDDIVKIIKNVKKESPTKIIIACDSYNSECIKFAKNFDFEIIILDKYQTYSLLYKEYEFYPQITAKYKKEGKTKFSDLILYSFNKARAKGYIFSALTLLIMSFFVKFNLYYYVVISILLLLSILSLTNKKYNTKKQKELL